MCVEPIHVYKSHDLEGVGDYLQDVEYYEEKEYDNSGSRKSKPKFNHTDLALD